MHRECILKALAIVDLNGENRFSAMCSKVSVTSHHLGRFADVENKQDVSVCQNPGDVFLFFPYFKYPKRRKTQPFVFGSDLLPRLFLKQSRGATTVHDSFQ